MKKKMTPESYARDPMAGVGVFSGFGTPENPPRYNLEDEGKKVLPKEDTHPGTGTRQLDGRAENPDGRVMLGEDD